MFGERTFREVAKHYTLNILQGSPNKAEEVIFLRTIDDLALRRKEKEAIKEAARILKERFPVRDVASAQSRGGMVLWQKERPFCAWYCC
jgi:hypothetical protein